MRRTITRAVVALAVTAAGLALGGAEPAAATTVEVDVVAGTIDVHEIWSPLLDTVDVVTATSCAAPTHTVTATAPDLIAVTLSFDQVTTVLGDDFRLVHDLQLSGTYVGGSVELTGTWTATAWRTAGPTSCTPFGGPCTIEDPRLEMTGTLTALAPPTLLEGDTLTFTGANWPSDATVTGWPWDCQGLVAHDWGYVVPTVSLEVRPIPMNDHPAAVGGWRTLRDPAGTMFDTVLHGSGGQCTPIVATVSAGGSAAGGPASAVVTSDVPYRSPNGVDFRVVTTTTLTGYHSSRVATLTGVSTATYRQTPGGGSCAPFGGTCTVTSSNLSYTGLYPILDATLYGTGDVLALSGGNSAPDTQVSGSPTVCADLLAVDGGSVDGDIVLIGS